MTDNGLYTLSRRQTLDIMGNCPVMDEGIVARIGQSRPHAAYPGEPTPPLAVPEAFSQALDALMADKGSGEPRRELHHSRWMTFEHVIALGQSSLVMAHILGGDIDIPRPRKLYEHTQSGLNIHAEYLADLYTDPRDRILPAAHFLKDIGKSYAVATHPARSSKGQAVHNNWMAARLLQDTNLDKDEQTVIRLLVEEDVIGRALRQHAEKGQPLDDTLLRAQQVLKGLTGRCPPHYRDRFMYQVAGVAFADMAAHTQRAYFISASDGRERQDVTDNDRYYHGDPARGETNRTLDRLFSEAPQDKSAIRFRTAARIAVIRGLFPDHYELFVSEADNV